MESEKSRDALARSAPVPGAAYVVLAVLLTAAPLLFGATDRFFQGILLALFALGLTIAPPALWREGSRFALAGLAVLGLLLVKEFAPAALFGTTDWRATLRESYQLTLPWTHHPEPVRAVEGLLAAAMALLWWGWIRTLAARKEGATRLLWLLALAGGVVGAVSLYFGHAETSAIYGWREIPGYKGFGPFPNRNHTACFLAMTLVAGTGVLVHTLRRKRFGKALLAGAVLLPAALALLETESRGGLVAVVAGLAFFGVMLTRRSPGWKAFATLLAAFLLALTLFFVFGQPLLERVANLGEVGLDPRWTIWRDAKQMWLAAPLFGHGVDSFGTVFPLYQSITSGNTVVLHPESSWLLGLSELGLVPMAILAAGLLWLLARCASRAQAEAAGWTLRAAALGAVAVLIVHSIYDVPAHRWATMACGLAALGVACPARKTRVRLRRGWALAPAAVAALWLVPLVTGRPLWSTAALDKALAANFSTAQVPTATLGKLAEYFPLDPDLQHSLGVRGLIARGSRAEAWRRFRLADRLKPSSYLLPVAQAVIAAPVSREMALYFWLVAIERSEHRAEEFFFMAWERTGSWPDAAGFWRGYAQANPRLLLSYARAVTPGEGTAALREWLDTRGREPQARFERFELENLDTFLRQWGSPAELATWMEAHPERRQSDGVRWARLLAGYGQEERAWRMLAERYPEPVFGESEAGRKAALLETEWRADPDNFLKARRLAGALDREGDTAMRDQVILQMAAKEKAPPWFLQRAAHLQARAGQFRAAVETMLRLPPE